MSSKGGLFLSAPSMLFAVPNSPSLIFLPKIILVSRSKNYKAPRTFCNLKIYFPKLRESKPVAALK